MDKQTVFPIKENTSILFDKILNDPWACERLLETFTQHLLISDEYDNAISAKSFTKALFETYTNRDLSLFLMYISKNTLFDLLRNAFLIPYKINADGKMNPLVLTDDKGDLKEAYKDDVTKHEYHHFKKVFENLEEQYDHLYFAQAYRYGHGISDDEIVQEIYEIHKGVLLVRKLPEDITQMKSEAEVYSAIWELMIELEKNLPLCFVFYGRNDRLDEIGIFLPNMHREKNLEKHIRKAEEIIYNRGWRNNGHES